MMDSLQSKRLLFRPFTIEDKVEAYRWFSDSTVMKFTPTGPDQNMATTEKRILNYIDAQTKHGFSKWLVIDRSTNKPIGDSGILWSEQLGAFELGFRLHLPYWGMGLATELALTWIQQAPLLGLTELFAFTHIENVASIKVLQKSGFILLKQEKVMGMNSFLFRHDLQKLESY